MKILIVHNAYGRISGEEVVIDNLAVLLAERGLIVQRFSRSSAEIETTMLGKIPAFFSGIHNPFSRREFGRFLRETRPDVVHIHNLYPLISPSILPECTAQGIPVVMTVHNFRLVCPNGLLLSHDEICHRCLGGREYWCVLRNCEKSIFKSTGYALRTASARILRRYLDNVSHFICLSEFQKNILVRAGLPANLISVMANPLSFAVQASGQEQKTSTQVHTKSNCHSRPAFAGSYSGGNLRNNAGSPTGPFGDDKRCGPFGDDKGVDPRQEHSGMTNGVEHSEMTDGVEHSGMTESRKISPYGRNDMTNNCDTIGAGMTVEGRVNQIDSVHHPSIPPRKGGKNADGHYVAYVGRLSPEKDILTFIEAARRLGDLQFKFAGSYHRMPEVIKQKPDNCEFLGQLDAEDLARFYYDARMVVFATRCYEGFPTVLLEAMSHGLPVVCSRIGGLPEIVEDGKTGLLYEPGNAGELADSIQTLWQDTDLCRKLGEAGKRKMQEDYAADRLLDRLMGIYEKVIKEKRSN